MKDHIIDGPGSEFDAEDMADMLQAPRLARKEELLDQLNTAIAMGEEGLVEAAMHELEDFIDRLISGKPQSPQPSAG